MQDEIQLLLQEHNDVIALHQTRGWRILTTQFSGLLAHYAEKLLIVDDEKERMKYQARYWALKLFLDAVRTAQNAKATVLEEIENMRLESEETPPFV